MSLVGGGCQGWNKLKAIMDEDTGKHSKDGINDETAILDMLFEYGSKGSKNSKLP